MVVDSSALCAVIFNEVRARDIGSALSSDQRILISAATLVECTIVIEGRSPDGGRDDLEALLQRIGANIVAVDEAQAHRAIDAWRRFGKGRHPAGLNFGDCFSYALAATTREPLLCVGDDFAKTDIALVL